MVTSNAIIAPYGSGIGTAGIGVTGIGDSTSTVFGYPNQPYHDMQQQLALQRMIEKIEQTKPTMKDALTFIVAPIVNGFLVGKQGDDTTCMKFCKNYTEVSEAIVAIMALNKLTEKK